MLTRLFSLFGWLLHLFNPPPLALMTFAQKVSRVLLFTVALVAACILAAMVFALVIYILQQGTRIMRDYPHLLNGLVIIFAAITVNAACVAVLFQIRKFDRMLMESETK